MTDRPTGSPVRDRGGVAAMSGQVKVNHAAGGVGSRLDRLYDLVSGDEDARVCRDIPAASCDDQPRIFFAYLGANTLNKLADELSSARLVLPWMLGAIGAPAAFSGFLVPIREAGVLLPQMAVAAFVRRMPLRKPVWLLGALRLAEVSEG